MSQRKNTKRGGFTLVELLVVISIIGMLMALLLPAVMSARETGRQNTCRNNLRNLGMAVYNFEVARGYYPGYTNDIYPANDRTGAFVANDDRSWIFVTLPYNDNRSMYESYVNVPPTGATAGQGLANTGINVELEICICPSAPPEAAVLTTSHYVCNVGPLDTRARNTTATTPAAGRDQAANGIFFDLGRSRIITTGANAGQQTQRRVRQRSAYVANTDGQAMTLMVAENADAGTWPGSVVTPIERWVGFAWDTNNFSNTATPPALPLAMNREYGDSKNTTPQSTDRRFTRPSSYHPGVCNFMFTDGHVRAINDTVSYGIYQALMTPDGRRATNSAGGVLTTSTAAPHGALNVRIGASDIP